jgi:aspartyl-tRNA(Asn)/glutamyl-tRNA(Gln) amidotransferase subunit B
VEQFRAAEADKQKKMMGFFMGQIMKASQGKANPGIVTPILMKLLKGQ